MEEKQKRTSVVADAMLKLKELIISDEYHVGDKIPTESELAQRFGIGRSSIREAIKVFQYLGIVETRVPKGTFLCKDNTMAAELLTWFSILEKKTIYEILEFREVFEQRGILNILDYYKTDPKLAHQIIEQLEFKVENIKKAIASKDLDEIQKADFNFHYYIIKQTGNALFLSIFTLLDKFIKTEMGKTHTTYDDLNKLIDEHLVIIDAIKSRDTLKVLEAHSFHFRLIRKNLILEINKVVSK
jgi:GntR family transcriptional repressor for pyruvate dehydrogenase complex